MRTPIACVLAATALLVTGCASSGSSEQGGAVEERTIGYSNPLGSEISFQAIGVGAEQAIEKLDLPWKVDEIDAKLSADKQVSDIDTMISQQVGGIASWTLNSGSMEPAYARAKAADIPVIGLNSESPSITVNAKTQTDSTCATGQEQAQYIAERIPGAKVLAVEGPEFATITYTNKCWREAAEAAGLTIVETVVDTDITEASGQKVTEAALLKVKDEVQAVWVFSDQTAVGSSAAIRAAGLKIWTEKDPSGVIVISRNGAASAIDYVKQGYLTAIWDSNMGELGVAAVQLLAAHYVDGVPLDELPKEVVIEATLYDITNADDYVPLLDRDYELLELDLK